jgi:hypothetical protein
MWRKKNRYVEEEKARENDKREQIGEGRESLVER